MKSKKQNHINNSILIILLELTVFFEEIEGVGSRELVAYLKLREVRRLDGAKKIRFFRTSDPSETIFFNDFGPFYWEINMLLPFFHTNFIENRWFFVFFFVRSGGGGRMHRELYGMPGRRALKWFWTVHFWNASCPPTVSPSARLCKYQYFTGIYRDSWRASLLPLCASLLPLSFRYATSSLLPTHYLLKKYF